MQDMFESVRRSRVFRSPTAIIGDGEDGIAVNLVEKINSCIRKSRVFTKPSPPPLPIRYRKGELIGCGAFGHVYMGMNLDSGELLAVKQVLVAVNSASKEQAQAHIRELEEEVRLLKNLSHPNIVRYLGTAREEETLNILLEFVPGGSISSLLGKFGSFPEAVIRMYTKQLLLGLDYLHKNGIMHRDIKGANILVDNKGCIKLADFGASKQVVELAGAKSVKGTPNWMAPEVIRQTGHSCSADIWSVGCTVIEMATGKPPWSEKYKEVAALIYHIGSTKAHPPLPEHLSAEANDFLLKCLQTEPEFRPPASELLKHPFVTGEVLESSPISVSSVMEISETSPIMDTRKIIDSSMDICNLGSMNFSTLNSEEVPENQHFVESDNGNDIYQIGGKDDLVMGGGAKYNTVMISDDFSKSFNPMCEPLDDGQVHLEVSPKPQLKNGNIAHEECERASGILRSPGNQNGDFTFSTGPSLSDDDDEVTETKIRAFLDEKALELKKLQTPLFEEFYNSMNPSCSSTFADAIIDEKTPKFLKLPPTSRSPTRGLVGTPMTGLEGVTDGSPGSSGRRTSSVGTPGNQDNDDTASPQLNGWKESVDNPNESVSRSANFAEIQRKWKEELDQELERKREMMRQAGVGGKTASPKDRASNRPREKSRFASPSK